MPKLLLDPWSPDYEGPIQTQGPETISVAHVDPNVEITEWRTIAPPDKMPGWPVSFVDGVRRVEARVLAQNEDGTLIHGIFASSGAGCVTSEGTEAKYGCMEIRRYLILGGGKNKEERISSGTQTLFFEGVSSPGDSPDDLVNALQKLMRTREAVLAETLLAPGTCVFADGPLNHFSAAKESLIGVIKRIFLPYLDAAHFAFAGQLGMSERTPLFLIRDGTYERYSWFQRLAAPRRMEHSLTGIVRLEVRAALGIERSAELANFAAARLPAFASSAVRDQRAPQNLVPVGALEDHLRGRLGDAITIRRAIERTLHEGVTV